MAVCICGDSARHLIEGMEPKDLEALRPVDASDVVLEAPTWQEARELSLNVWGERGLHADVLVLKEAHRRTSQELDYHLWRGDIPPRSLMLTASGTLLTTPWFDLILCSSGLSTVELSKRIMGMTAVFRMTRTAKEGFVESKPFTTTEELSDYLTSAKGLQGIARVREALEWSPPRARSPREIDATLALVMPRRRNGCGLPLPELNHRVDPSIAARKMMGKEEVFVDLFWRHRDDAHIDSGVEYLGKEHHTNLGEDLTRANALSLEGIDLQLMADEQLKSAGQILMIAKRVARAIGFKPYGNKWPSEEDLQGLIDQILK